MRGMPSHEDRRRGVLAAIDRVASAGEPADALERATGLLYETFERYGWVGIYLIDGDELVLGPWKGPEPSVRTRIPIGTGVGGIAAWSQRTLVVDDSTEGEYEMPQFGWTRSEIAVPMKTHGAVLGAITIESGETAAFDAGDRAFLERVADILSTCVTG